MRTHRLYVDVPLAVDAEITLDQRASHYLGTVLRVKAGQKLNVFNNHGGCYDAVVVSASKKTVVIETLGFDDNDRMPKKDLTIAVGITKGDRMDLLMQKATELGVHSIQPLWMDFCDVKLPKERLEKKIHHWRQITIASSEQSERNRLPFVNEPLKFDDWLNAQDSTKVIGFHPNEAPPEELSEQREKTTFCFGPEGGFSDREVVLMESQGVQLLSLGERILRAETAPLVLLSFHLFAEN